MVFVDGTIVFIWRVISNFLRCLVSLHRRINRVFEVLSFEIVQNGWRYHLWIVVIYIGHCILFPLVHLFVLI